MMYDFCREYNVPFRQCGKLIVASSQAQSQQLQAIAKKAQDNGVTDLKWLSQDQAREVEPHVQCHAVRMLSCGFLPVWPLQRQIISSCSL